MHGKTACTRLRHTINKGGQQSIAVEIINAVYEAARGGREVTLGAS